MAELPPPPSGNPISGTESAQPAADITSSYSETLQTDPSFFGRLPWWKKWRKTVLSAFIIWNIAGISLYLAAPSVCRDRLLTIFQSYIWYVGLWQSYCVFVPDPKNYNVRLTANVTLKDGKVMQYRFPHPADDDLFTRMMTERYRRWAHDNVNAAEWKVWWPDAARWIARKYYDPQNPPVRVDFVRSWIDIPNPGSAPVPLPLHMYNFYSYQLTEGEIR